MVGTSHNAMPPYLLQQLFTQIKRLTNRELALVDKEGLIYTDVSDFSKSKRFTLKQAVSQDRPVVLVEESKDLLALPIYLEDKFYVTIVTRVTAEDSQTIELITSLAELIIQQFVVTHRPRPDAVDLLLTRLAYKPSSIDQEELELQMAALGYRLDVQRVAMAIELPGFWENYLQTVGQPHAQKESLIVAKKHDIEASLASFFTRNQDNIVGYIGNDIFLILKDLVSTDYQRFCQLMTTHFNGVTNTLKNVYIKQVTIGIGLPSNQPAGLLTSASQALQVLEIGRRIYGANAAYCYDNLGVLPLLLTGNIDQKKSYAAKIFHLLDDEELIETLATFLKANLNLTQTAEQLKIHRNTVIYRLDKITEILGKDPRQFSQATELYLAMLFDKTFNKKPG